MCVCVCVCVCVCACVDPGLFEAWPDRGCESPAQHHTRLRPSKGSQAERKGFGAAHKARPRHTIIDDDLTGAVCGLLSSRKWPPKSRAISELGPK